jgi:hypothetical protein
VGGRAAGGEQRLAGEVLVVGAVGRVADGVAVEGPVGAVGEGHDVLNAFRGGRVELWRVVPAVPHQVHVAPDAVVAGLAVGAVGGVAVDGDEAVVAVAAVHGVGAGAADDGVIAVVAGQVVVVVTADEAVVAGVAVGGVVAGHALDGVVAVAGPEGVVALVADHGVVAVAADELVGGAVAFEVVVAAEAEGGDGHGVDVVAEAVVAGAPLELDLADRGGGIGPGAPAGQVLDEDVGAGQAGAHGRGDVVGLDDKRAAAEPEAGDGKEVPALEQLDAEAGPVLVAIAQRHVKYSC